MPENRLQVAWRAFKCRVAPLVSIWPLHFSFSLPWTRSNTAGIGGQAKGRRGSLAHFLGMLPPKVRFPCPLAFPSSFRTRGTGSFSFWATRPSLPPVPTSARSNDVFLHVEHASRALAHCLLFRLLLLVFVLLRSTRVFFFFLLLLLFSSHFCSSSSFRASMIAGLATFCLLGFRFDLWRRSVLRWPVIRLFGLGQRLLASMLVEFLGNSCGQGIFFYFFFFFFLNRLSVQEDACMWDSDSSWK